jgi:hypothetical protein
MENRFVFNAEAEKAQVQQIFDDCMIMIENNLKQGQRRTIIQIPIQYSSEVKSMIENILFVGKNKPNKFGWKSYGSSGNGSKISETWNGIREYTLCYYGD